jgi:hypothetical protein
MARGRPGRNSLVMDGEVECDWSSPTIRRWFRRATGSIPLATRRSEWAAFAPGAVYDALPAGAATSSAAQPGVILLQTLAGRDTVERWAEIAQTTR